MRLIADYVEATRGTRAGEPAREAAFRCILDLLGCAAAAVAEPASVAVRSTALGTMAAGSVPIWFTGLCSSATAAAWANSAAASALDLDDGHRLARGHPGAAVIPTAFAVAHEAGATLEDLITAIVIGYEVGVTSAPRDRLRHTGTWASYAVVAPPPPFAERHAMSSRMRSRSPARARPTNCFRAPRPQTPAPEGSDVKEGIPWSVVTGLVALGLAEADIPGRGTSSTALFYRFPTGPRSARLTHRQCLFQTLCVLSPRACASRCAARA